MLKFDFNALEDFKMTLSDDEITVEFAEETKMFPAEKWREAYGMFFVAAGEWLTSRDDWSFVNDFSQVHEIGSERKNDENDGEIPTIETRELSSARLLDSFEKLKRAAFNSAKGKKEQGEFEEIYDETAYLAMRRIWYLYSKKLMTVEEARNETAAVFREYRRYRLMLESLEEHEKSVFKSYQAQQELLKRSAHLYSFVIKNAGTMSDETLVDMLIDIISAQSGEGVSGEILRKKIEERRQAEYVRLQYEKSDNAEENETENEPMAC